MSADLTIQVDEITFCQIKKAALMLRALTNPLCQSILKLMELREEFTVTEICISLRIEQSVVSSHLSKLRRYAIVKNIKKGKYTYYSLNQEKLIKLNNTL